MQVAINRNMCLWGYYLIQGDPQNFNMYCLANSGSTEPVDHNTSINILFWYCKYMISISILKRITILTKKIMFWKLVNSFKMMK